MMINATQRRGLAADRRPARSGHRTALVVRRVASQSVESLSVDEAGKQAVHESRTTL